MPGTHSPQFSVAATGRDGGDDILSTTFGNLVVEEGVSGDCTPFVATGTDGEEERVHDGPQSFGEVLPLRKAPAGNHTGSAPSDANRLTAEKRRRPLLRYSQQVALMGAYSALGGSGAASVASEPPAQQQQAATSAASSAGLPSTTRVDATTLTAAWRNIQLELSKERARLASAATTGVGRRTDTGATATDRIFAAGGSGGTPSLLPPQASGCGDDQQQQLAAKIASSLAAALLNPQSFSSAATAGDHAEGSAAASLAQRHHGANPYNDQLLLIIRQLVHQQEDLVQRLSEATSGANLAATTTNPMLTQHAHALASTPPLDGSETPRPPSLFLTAAGQGDAAGESVDLLGGTANGVGGKDLATLGVDDTSRSIIMSLREQIAQMQQRENEWRRQVNTLQLMVDDAKEESERAGAEHADEVAKLQKTIDLLLQDIEMDMENYVDLSATVSGGGGGPLGSSVGADHTPNAKNPSTADAEDKVQMLRKVRNAIQRGGSMSPLAKSSQALHKHYERVVSNAIKEETEILATSITEGNSLPDVLAPEFLGKLQAAVRKGSMRRAHSMGQSLDAMRGDGLGHSPLSDRLSSSVSQPNTPQCIGGVSPATVGGASPAANPCAPMTVFHATNPNQIGEVINKAQCDEQWVFIEAIKAGLQAEVCKTILDHYEDSQKPARAGPLKGIVKGLVNSVAAAANTVAATMAEPLSHDTDITKETTEYYCHLAKDAVVTRKTLPTSLPPLKASNSNKQLLSIFHGINATFAPSPAIGSAEASGQGRLVCRGDQIRLRFFAPKCFAMIREKLCVDPEHLKLSIEQCDWRKASSPGKSEALMFYFGDYVLKTVKNVESSFLKSTYIPAFTSYASSNPHTLLPNFMTFFSVTWLLKRQTFTFILMKNVFSTRHYINCIYDLKGSTVGREAAREDDGNGKSEVKRTAFGALLLKDNDLPRQLIYCGPLRRAVMIAQLQADTLFLQSLNIVDYSLMVGVRSRVVSKGGSEEQRAAAYLDVDGGCMRASNGGLLSLAIYDEHDMNTVREDTYYIGIIDCLQPYNSSKKLEHFAKGLLMYDRHKISVVPPEEYAERLCKLIDRISV